MHDLQDMLWGMEEQLGVKEGLLEDYRESTSSLRAMVQQMQQEKLGRWEEGNTGTTTTGINTSILPGEKMSAVQSHYHIKCFVVRTDNSGGKGA